MDFKECLKTRRSIRKYKDTPVTKEEIESIVELASFAPTWKNSQTARYTAVLDSKIKENIAENAVMGFKGNSAMIENAPVLIVVSTVEKRCDYERDGSFSTSKGTHWQSFDAGASAFAFCLAAHELGLGTCIMEIYDEEKIAELIDLPEGQSVSALIALGHPDIDPAMPKRKTVDELLTVK